jgi:hypothetical protein
MLDLIVQRAIAPPGQGGQEGWREAPGWWIKRSILSIHHPVCAKQGGFAIFT